MHCKQMLFSADEEMRFQTSCKGGRGQCQQTQFSCGKLFQVSGPETAKFLQQMTGCALRVQFARGSRPQVSTSCEVNDRLAELSEISGCYTPQTFVDQHCDLVSAG